MIQTHKKKQKTKQSYSKKLPGSIWPGRYNSFNGMSSFFWGGGVRVIIEYET